jgi:hypothetical protein
MVQTNINVCHNSQILDSLVVGFFLLRKRKKLEEEEWT